MLQRLVYLGIAILLCSNSVLGQAPLKPTSAEIYDDMLRLNVRANDFGYSKHPDETMRIWNEDEVKADAVWAIRKLQPDIIINRFDHKSAGRTHGHHTASAVISYDVFEKANDPKVYPDQLKYVQPWQAQRLFFNTSWWFYGSREKFEKADKSGMVAIDAGVFYPLKGKSNTEIAAESRSMHQCQGMGNTGRRGSQTEYLEILKGDLPKNSTDPMVNINTSWSRVEGGEVIGKKVDKLISKFSMTDPGKSIATLLDIYKMIEQLPDGKWKHIKLAECLDLIKACSGLFAETVSDAANIVPGGMVNLKTEVIQRAGTPFTFKGMKIQELDQAMEKNQMLTINEGISEKTEVKVPYNIKNSTPYWLIEKATLGMYAVPDQSMRGIPENPAAFNVSYGFELDGKEFEINSPVVYKKNDAVKGETYSPFVVTPPFSVAVQEKVAIFAQDQTKTITVKVKALGDEKEVNVRLIPDDNWKVTPMNYKHNFSQKGEDKSFTFEVTPPADGQSTVYLTAEVNYGPGSTNMEVVEIDYDHIPKQTVLQKAQTKVVKIDVKKVGNRVGYIMGAGDDIPASLEQIGYQVDLLQAEGLSASALAVYDAVILGIRAFNTKPALKFSRNALMEYVEQGGNLIVQYNTNRRLVTEDIAPYPMKLSRDRVAVEEAEVRFLAPAHPVLNVPNKITQADFEGWVQERGLYFANEWDEAFTPILSANDPGEDPKDGGMLIASYGKGNYIYSGYSWFRELPAGVPGAYRLFANMISLASERKP